MNPQLQRVSLLFAVAACYIGFVCFSVAFADDPPPGYKTCKGCVTVGETTSYFEITCPEDWMCCGYTNSFGNPDVYCRNPNIGENHEDYNKGCLAIVVCAPPPEG